MGENDSLQTEVTVIQCVSDKKENQDKIDTAISVRRVA